MALFGKKEDKDKKKKTEGTAADSVKAEKSVKEEKASEAKAEKSEKTDKPAKSKEDTGDAYRVLIRPLVTEKNFRQAQLSKYAFKVNSKANKITVKKAVEKVYDVHVQNVNIVSVRGKQRNYGRNTYRTADWKKAVVTLKKGEVIPGAEG